MLTGEELEEATRIVRGHVPVTPAYRWPLLEEVTGIPTWAEHENATPTGAFKVRSGLVFVDRLLRTDPPCRAWLRRPAAITASPSRMPAGATVSR